MLYSMLSKLRIIAGRRGCARRGRAPMTRRCYPCLETLEGRILPSITASVDAQATAEETLVRDANQSTANAMASVQDDNGSASTQSSGSVQVAETSLSASASVSANAQNSQNSYGQPYFGASGEVTISGNISVSTLSTITITADLQFSTSPLNGHAVGGVELLFNSVEILEVGYGSSGALDSVSGTPVSYSSGPVGPGTYSFTAAIGTASYNGSAAEGPQNCSLGFSVTEVAQTSDTTTMLVAAPNPSSYGQPVTFTASVSPTGSTQATPTGTVTFEDGTNPLAPAVALVGGTATISTSALTVGVHSITADYSGDSNFNGSTSSPVALTVNKAATTTSLTSSPNPSAFGQPVALTATVSPDTAGQPTPTGSVTFTDGSTPLGTAQLDASGTATLPPTTALPVGTQTITATYTGDSNYQGSSGYAQQTVKPAPQAQLKALTLGIDPSNASIDFTYSIATSALPVAVPIDLFWATGPNYPTDVIKATGYSYIVAAGSQPQQAPYGPITIAPNALAGPPAGAQYLLLVADPNNVLGTFSATNVVALRIIEPVTSQDVRQVVHNSLVGNALDKLLNDLGKTTTDAVLTGLDIRIIGEEVALAVGPLTKRAAVLKSLEQDVLLRGLLGSAGIYNSYKQLKDDVDAHNTVSAVYDLLGLVDNINVQFVTDARALLQDAKTLGIDLLDVKAVERDLSLLFMNLETEGQRIFGRLWRNVSSFVD